MSTYPTDAELRSTSDFLGIDIPVYLSVLLPVVQTAVQGVAPLQALLNWGLLVLSVLGAVVVLAFSVLLAGGVLIALDGLVCAFNNVDTVDDRTYWAELRVERARLDRLRLRLADQYYAPFMLEWAAAGAAVDTIADRLNVLCRFSLFSADYVGHWLNGRIEAERKHQAALREDAERQHLLRTMVADIEKTASDSTAALDAIRL